MRAWREEQSASGTAYALPEIEALEERAGLLAKDR
jgi:hypothetical protein